MNFPALKTANGIQDSCSSSKICWKINFSASLPLQVLVKKRWRYFNLPSSFHKVNFIKILVYKTKKRGKRLPYPRHTRITYRPFDTVNIKGSYFRSCCFKIKRLDNRNVLRRIYLRRYVYVSYVGKYLSACTSTIFYGLPLI